MLTWGQIWESAEFGIQPLCRCATLGSRLLAELTRDRFSSPTIRTGVQVMVLETQSLLHEVFEFLIDAMPRWSALSDHDAPTAE